MSDDAPCTTNCFCPVSLKPLPLRVATQAIFSGRCLTPSSIAMPITVSPAKMPGNQRSRIALSANFNASTAATDVVKKGEGDRLRPISSRTIPASIWPMPMPPSASGMRMPVKPISANCFQRPWLKPSLQPMSRNLRKWVTGASLAIKSRALSRSMFWSSFKVIAMIRPLAFREYVSIQRSASLRWCRPRSNWLWCATNCVPWTRHWPARFPTQAPENRQST